MWFAFIQCYVAFAFIPLLLPFWVSLPYLLVCFIFSCHCVTRVYFPTEFRVSQNSSCSAPPERCLFSLPVRQIRKLCVFEWLRDERGSGPESRFFMTPAKSVCFQICPTTIPETPAHILSRTHCAQSSLRKQAAAITRAQTGPALCRKTCAHFPGSWLTDHCPFIHYRTWKSPKSQENTFDIFWLHLHKTTLWI